MNGFLFLCIPPAGSALLEDPEPNPDFDGESKTHLLRLQPSADAADICSSCFESLFGLSLDACMATQTSFRPLNCAGRITFDSSEQLKMKCSLQARIPFIWHTNTSSFLIIPQVVALETAE